MECDPIIGTKGTGATPLSALRAASHGPSRNGCTRNTFSALIAMTITIKTKSAPPAPPAGVDELLSPKEIQGWLKTSRPSFYRWIKMGQFPKHDLIAGCKPRWKKSTVQAWIDSKGTQATQVKG